MVPVFDFSRVIGFAKSILVTIAVFTAAKALLVAAIMVLVPYAIYKSGAIIGEQTMAFIGSQLAGNAAWSGTFVELTGLAGWMGSRLQLQACFQILATFVVMRYVLSFFHKG